MKTEATYFVVASILTHQSLFKVGLQTIRTKGKFAKRILSQKKTSSTKQGKCETP